MKTRIPTHWVVGGVIVLLLGAVALGLLARGREDDKTLERVQATGELRVGLDASFPPFESLDADGNVVGFDADLARAIAAGLGAEPVFVNVGFDGLYDALWASRVDVVISGLPYDPRRTQDVNYSQPYFNAGQVLVVRADDTAFTQNSAGIPMPAESIPNRSAGIPMPALSGRVVAVEWGSLADMEARRLKETAEDLETLPQPTAQDALNALVAGQADAAIADAVSVYQFIGEGGAEVRITAVLTDEPYVIATRVKSRRLAGAIDDALTNLRETGVLDELMDTWF
jgi:polar amino acid transport system substrate-binding protein